MITVYSRIQRGFLGALALTIAAGLLVHADEGAFWPQFHGPNRDNISSETDLLETWPEGGPELIWTVKGLGYGYSTVAIADGRIFSSGNIGDDTVVTALDLNGEILWQVKNGAAWTTAYPGTRGTPTVDGDFVYNESPHGDVACINAKTGEKVWEVNVLEKYGATNIRWAVAESLLVDEKNVICSPGGPEVSLVALDKLTGEVAWTAPSTGDATAYASPALFEQRGLRIVTTLTAKALIGVDADTGELLWRVDHESYTDQNTMLPIYHDGHLFVSTVRGGSVKWRVDVSDGVVSLEEIWRNEQFDNQHGGVVLIEGNIYGASTSRNRNLWVCLDWETGEIEHLGKEVERGSITSADGLLYMLGQDGQMGLVQPLEASSKMISTFNIPEGGEGNSWAHPVVAGGRLYIRHAEFLYAYDVRASE